MSDNDRKTTVIAGLTSTERAALESAASGEPTATTGGRLVAADGSVYRVPDEGLTIGRDAGCGLVLDSSNVSRRHAAIAPTLLGYSISDQSTNGVLVNGVRIEGAQRLGRGDIVRIGDEELRFDADDTSFEPAALDQSELAVLPALDRSGQAAPDEAHLRRPTIETAASTRPAAPAAPTLLATLEVLTDGVLKGTRFRIERPIAQLGRADHNDVRLPDPSVSGTHATLLQRNGRWHLLDLGSRNGSYVDGERVVDHSLGGACELRLGNVKLLFRPIAPAAADTKGTVGIVGLTDAEIEKYKPR
jgi:pSer/pThr/pTyr-binding forkhead associated (FHA) protein